MVICKIELGHVFIEPSQVEELRNEIANRIQTAAGDALLEDRARYNVIQRSYEVVLTMELREG